MGLRFGPDPRLHSHHLGISLDAAKTYLKRVKARYQQAGIPVYPKLDLVERVRADWAGEPARARPQRRPDTCNGWAIQGGTANDRPAPAISGS